MFQKYFEETDISNLSGGGPTKDQPLLHQNILVCGATGYVGGRLVPRLLDEGYHVTCLVRSPEKLADFAWRTHPRLRIVEGSVDDPNALRRASGVALNSSDPSGADIADIGTASSGRGESSEADAVDGNRKSEKGMPPVDVAYYLVHSMISAGSEYVERDRSLASCFAGVMQEAGCKRIVYLGGLGEKGSGLSKHLQSRREVEDILKDSGIPTTVFRAAMIIGSGSASFEILRYLVDRLPVMICPRWVKTETQPIAIRDVLRYLVQCLVVPETAAKTLDIGGTEVFTFRELMQIMAEASGLPRRVILPVPVLTPRLSSGWISLVTPVNGKIARPLAEGLRNKTVCRNDLANQLMPGPRFGVRQAIDAALGKLQAGDIETRWSTAGEMPGDPEWSGGTVYLDQRSIEVDASAAETFRTICKIGGPSGYWGAGFLWRLRGWMDQVVGGPGLRRGRRHPERLSYGEVVDFWRVSGYRKSRLLRLHAEMYLPGDAELEFQLEELGPAKTKVTQTARFRPLGLLGMAYWYSVLPAHIFVFPTMLRGIKSETETRAARSQSLVSKH